MPAVYAGIYRMWKVPQISLKFSESEGGGAGFLIRGQKEEKPDGKQQNRKRSAS